MYKQELASFWTVDEVDLSNDLRDWQRLTCERVPGSMQRVWCCVVAPHALLARQGVVRSACACAP
jgi:hypothetical protein